MISAHRALGTASRPRWLVAASGVRLGVGSRRRHPIDGCRIPLAGKAAHRRRQPAIFTWQEGQAGRVAAEGAVGVSRGRPPSRDIRFGHVMAGCGAFVFLGRRQRARLQHANLNREIGQTLQGGVVIATSWFRHSGGNIRDVRGRNQATLHTSCDIA